MQILLDTHAFLWFADGNPKLSERAQSSIESADNERFLSLASLWEMAIKKSAGRLLLDVSIESLVEQAEFQGIELLPPSVLCIVRVADLPFHHRDPFDRLLAAHCLTDNLTLVSSDGLFDAYGVKRIW